MKFDQNIGCRNPKDFSDAMDVVSLRLFTAQRPRIDRGLRDADQISEVLLRDLLPIEVLRNGVHIPHDN